MQPAVGLLSPPQHSANPALPSSWLGSREETAIPINHKPCWLNPYSYFTQLQPGAKAVLQTALSCDSAAWLHPQSQGKNWVFIYVEFAAGPGFSTCMQPRSDILPSVRFVRITGETENFHQALKEPVKSFIEHLQWWVRKDGPCSRAVDCLLHTLGKGYAGISSTSPELFRKLKTKIPWTFLCFYS